MIGSGVHFDASVWESLIELTGGSPDLLIELLDQYLFNSPPRLERLRQAVSSQNPRTIEFEAHSLKSSAAALGMNVLKTCCQSLELAGRRADVKVMPRLLTELDREFNLSLMEIQRMRRQLQVAS